MTLTSLFYTVGGSLARFRIGTLLFITFLATTSQCYILNPSRTTSNTTTQHHLALFNLGVILIYWTFYLACKDPGPVRYDYVPPTDVGVRYCKTCKQFKPPRTYHCKKCGRCNLRMDHHCPWLSGCVGYRNHAAFIKFMTSVVPTTGYLAWKAAEMLWHYYTDTKGSIFVIAITVFNFVRIGAIGTCLPVSVLLSYQIWCLLENMTTIESWHKKCTDEMIRRKTIPAIDFPYDLYSSADNIGQVFGDQHMCKWLWPTTRATGSGHEFPVNEDADTTRSWPPAVSKNDTNHSSVNARKGKPQSHEVRYRRLASTNEDDLTYDDYGTMGLIDDSDASDDDYVDGDGEVLEDYGVDDGHEITNMEALVDSTGMTLGQLLIHKRSLENDRTRLSH